MEHSPAITKALLRKQYLEARRALPPACCTEAGDAIARRLYQNPYYQQADTLLAYVSAKDNEVDTLRIIDAALASGKRVLVPVVVKGEKEVRWASIQSRKELVRTPFGLLEPEPARACYHDAPERGLCLVPGVVFSKSGYRIGYGGGYYDRFLAGFSGNAIGLAYECQVISEVPTDAHDQPVEHVCTETGWYPEPGAY